MLLAAGAEVGEVTLNDEIFGTLNQTKSQQSDCGVKRITKNVYQTQRQDKKWSKRRRTQARQKGTGRHRQEAQSDPRR